MFVEVCGGSDKLFTAHTDMIVIPNTTQRCCTTRTSCWPTPMVHPRCRRRAGMWLLMEMLDARVPCWLAFFRAEEVGGFGFAVRRQDNPAFFKSFTHCISFDRRGTGDVITHQSWGRCCSDEFAAHLSSSALNEHGLDYRPNDGGIFTDSAEHDGPDRRVHELQHRIRKRAPQGRSDRDVDHLLRLRDALVKIDWTTHAG